MVQVQEDVKSSGVGAPSAPPTASRSAVRREDVLALIPCGVFWAIFIWRSSWVSNGRRQFTLFDDAMISMRYAQTFADGYGLVWYRGAPRVEGYTNPLWTLVMALFHLVGLDGSAGSLAIMVLGALLLAGTAVLAAGLTRLCGARSRLAPVLAVLVVGCCFPLVFWTLRGMEVGLLTFLTVASAFLALRLREEKSPRVQASLLGLLLVMLVAGLLTRTDFAVVAVAVLVWLGWRLDGAARSRALAILGSSCLLVIVAQTAFRAWYYGSALPNTYVLKMTGVTTSTRLERGIEATSVTWLAAFLAAMVVVGAALIWSDLRRLEGTWLLLGIVAGLGLYSIYVGGDAWENLNVANRYLVPALVSMLVAAVVGADRLALQPRVGRVRLAALGALVVGIALLGPFLGKAIGRLTGFSPDSIIGPHRVVVMAAVLGVVGLAAVAWFFAQRPGTSKGTVVILTVLALAPSVGLGLRPAFDWITTGLDVKEDQGAVEAGKLLEQLTREDAHIALVWAGAPAYYSNRPSVDLLGKSDPVVARTAPKTDFLPGHNKWDYDYSIGKLRPDLVAQIWEPSMHQGSLFRKLRSWGYVPAELESSGEHPWSGLGVTVHGKQLLFVRRDSSQVRWPLLRRVPWDAVMS